ncbi:MAG TPA: NUDIX hydrolase [Lacisediminihabitans sp.]|uniref:NUDIX hydrolase n=1 Tax=Lacisediminihabitans sp. TaxID=2787631 RepID=UPI002ED8E2A6
MTLVEHEVELGTGERTVFLVDETFPFGAAVLLLDDDRRLCLSWQYRFPLDRWILDLPGGAGMPGESPEEAAARECREELGLDPEALIPLHTFYPNPGRVSWPVHLFFCSTTHPAVADRSDPSEQVEAARMSLDDLDALIREGTVVDPALLIARMMAGVRGLLPPLR